MENSENLNQEFNELKEKYDSLIQKVDNLERENTHRENSVEQMENSFEVINNNIKELMEKIDSIIEDKETSKMFSSVRRSNSSVMNMITMPMRKATVNTMRAIFSVADFASEKMATARENLEDIVAEAQYENKKRRSSMITSEQG